MIQYFYSQPTSNLVLADRLFFLIAFVELVSQLFLIPSLKFVLKCIPIFILIYITLQVKKTHNLIDAKYLVAALVFGAIGDFFMLFVKQLPFFLTGALSFGISHLFYIILSRKKSEIIVTRSDKEQRNINIGVGAIWILTISNFFVMWSKLPHKLGFITYGIVLCMMITLSIIRFKNVLPKSYWTVLAGAICFGISDNILGLIEFNRINSPIGYVVIMTTYYGSQYLLCYGNLIQLISMKKKY